MKYALINTDRLDTVERYLPANYDAVPFGPFVLVYGTDNRGWTLEDYVLPRLASGLFYPVPEDQAHEEADRILDQILAVRRAAGEA